MLIEFHVALFADNPRGKAIRVGSEPLGLVRKRSEKALLWLLEAGVNINRMQLRDNKLPLLYNSGVRYKREPRGEEKWRDAVHVFSEQHGDCEDLSMYRIAELRNSGRWAEPYIRFRVAPDGLLIYHVMVFRGKGKLEDPSKILGMEGSD